MCAQKYDVPRIILTRQLKPSLSVIEDDEERRYYVSSFLASWNGTRTRRVVSTMSLPSFPGCNPRSIARSDLPNLQKEAYVISLKSDGVRYALFLTCRPSGSAVALMIDRSWSMFEIEVIASDEHFVRGTILEGELVWQQPDMTKLLYLVFDAVVVCGRNIRSLSFDERMHEATKCTRLAEELGDTEADNDVIVETGTIVIVHYNPSILIRPKCFVERHHAARLWNDRVDFDHRVDGIILHSCASSYGANAVYKWKEHSTVDLRVVGHDVETREGRLPQTMLGRSVEIKESKIERAENNIVEFMVRVDDTTIYLYPLRLRVDKSDPNSARVVLATVQDVLDDVSVYDIANTFVNAAAATTTTAAAAAPL